MPDLTQPSRARAGGRGERTRERILEAALEIVARLGPGAVTYRVVADAAETSLGVMTYHFGSRRELLSQAYQLHLQRLRFSAGELPVLEIQELSQSRKAELLTGYVTRMVREDRVRSMADYELMLELARDPELRGTVESDMNFTRSLAEELLRVSGSRRPIEDAMLVSAMIQGLVIEWLARGDDSEFEARVARSMRRLVDLVFPAS